MAHVDPRNDTRFYWSRDLYLPLSLAIVGVLIMILGMALVVEPRIAF